MSFEQINSALASGKGPEGIPVATTEDVRWLADHIREIYGF